MDIMYNKCYNYFYCIIKIIIYLKGELDVIFPALKYRHEEQ